MYSIEFTKAAAKALASMPRNTRDLVKAKIVALAADPSDVGNVKKLVGRPGFLFRDGASTEIYTLDSGHLVVLVLDIGPRGGIYQ